MGKDEIEPSGERPFWPPAERHTALAPAASLALQGAELPGRGREFSIVVLLRVLWERRWLILAMLAVGIAGAITSTLLATPQYRSTAVIEISPPSFEILEKSKSSIVPDDLNFLPTQYGLLESRSLAERVVQQLNLGANETLVPAELDRESRQNFATSVLQQNIDIDPVTGSRLVRVNYSSPDPTLAAQVANGIAEAFISTSLERRYQASSYARNFLQTQIASSRRELENSERALVAYAQQQNIVNTGAGPEGGGSSDRNSLAGESLVALNRALSEAQARRIAAEQRYRQSAGGAPSSEVSERTANYRAQIAALQAEYRDKENIFQPNYPEMVRLRSRISTLQEAMRNEATNVQAGRASTLRSEYQAAVAEEQALVQRVTGLRQETLNLRGRSIQYNILQREVDTNRQIFDALLQRFREIGVAGGVGASNASIIDRAEVPGGPYRPNLILNLLVGIGLSLAAGIGLALLLEFISDRIKNPDDVRDKLGLAFLGGVPTAESPLEALADPTSEISEAYRAIAATLGFIAETGVPRILMVTSTRPSEGKSTSAFAIAQALARLDNRVLIIDADLRKPSFRVDAEPGTGLTHLLTHGEPLASEVLATEHERLWLLPCGTMPPNPAELLATPRFRELLREAAASYDVVIVDGPPVLGLADAPLLGAMCTGAVLVVEADRTRTRAIIETLHRLRASGTWVVGTALTRYKHQTASYGYSYEAYSYKSDQKNKRDIRIAFQPKK